LVKYQNKSLLKLEGTSYHLSISGTTAAANIKTVPIIGGMVNGSLKKNT